MPALTKARGNGSVTFQSGRPVVYRKVLFQTTYTGYVFFMPLIARIRDATPRVQRPTAISKLLTAAHMTSALFILQT